MNRIIVCFLFIMVGFLFAAGSTSQGEVKMKGLQLTSPAFKHNEHIPKKYTCDGANVNPPLLIKNMPENAKSLALIVDDPDAPGGTWVHWVVWNISPFTGEIKENSVPAGAQQGINDFRKHNYGGPCPPSGTHRYFFKIYALDKVLGLDADTRKSDLERAMQGHVIGRVEIVGLYKR
ncbi:MAG: YbhB/YbcL family Raf kinase inhibitor-like protein [Nitrospirota bacterium]